MQIEKLDKILWQKESHQFIRYNLIGDAFCYGAFVDFFLVNKTQYFS
ncbi:MAG: hypothetical protein ACTS8U_04030 [Arsenophonus sp. ET-DL9-MAG3]